MERGEKNGFSAFDLQCMKRALRLARRGEGRVSPNPLVGAVVARGGRVLGEGWHRRYGGPHAEAMALAAVRAAGEDTAGADLYCTLEPCAFTSPEKHQPPCTDLVRKSGIRRVVIANKDPNPRVNGKGIRTLRKAGIQVETGLLSAQGEELNRAFFTFQRLGRPFVHLKIAQSLDGKIAALKAGRGPQWITGGESRKIVHRMRGCCDAVLIGKGTALADDPELTVRHTRGRNPARVVLDSRLALPLGAKLLAQDEPQKTIIFCAAGADKRKIQALKSRGARVIPLPKNRGGKGLSLRAALAALGETGARSVLVEGGEKVFSSFLREGLWDRLSVFIAPLILGTGKPCVAGLAGSLARAIRPENVTIRKTGNDILFEGDNVYRNC
ncbi:MAG: bifunctional diaminohydroxyphosphoribosylaminopyrimidine deaminase/5-amino-6-(5-phosphoribosylamino)uracil reductase RibD [Spirochaetaceae bacterium]|nr:bifunctional diaminohydroxyphosphoribosylaminopyrimidine deaminase/5-amino-6-(5-phosphoribosylamino)uracil reductase RibD [Spirochaetaceae bacterium]